MKTPGLYIHVPFCRKKCGYCDFYSETTIGLIPLYIESVIAEMTLYSTSFGTFDTVYIGGGTPSVLTPGELDRIFEGLHERFDISSKSEITLEANPADLTRDYLRSLRRLGVNRLNIGVQSFQSSVLEFLGRRHGSTEAVQAITSARDAGFENIGLDLICGVPGVGISEWIDDLIKAISLEPEHLSCYELSLSTETPLGKKHSKGLFRLPDENLSLKLFIKTAEILENAGYFHYEVSNYAQEPAFASRHNQKYWDHSPYLGLGPGAHSFREGMRWWNHRSLIMYARDIAKGMKPIKDMESLSKENLIIERLFLGLRTAKGIDLFDLRESDKSEPEHGRNYALRLLQEEGLAVIRDGRLIPTLRGLAVADRLPLIL